MNISCTVTRTTRQEPTLRRQTPRVVLSKELTG